MKPIIKKIIIFLLLTIGITFTTTLALGNGKISLRDSSIVNPKDNTNNYIKKVKYNSRYVYFSDLVAINELPSADKIYVMEDATDLYNWSILASGSDRQKYLDKHYILGADINYSAEISDPSTMHFRSIGFLGSDEVLPVNPTEQQIFDHGANNKNAFQGTFDGRGFTIKNLLLERVDYSNINSVYQNSIEYLAPFARIGRNGILKNVGFISTVVTGTMDFGVIKYVSNVAGEMHGRMERVFYRDERTVVQQGISFIGKVHISGLVSKVYAYVYYSYVAATRLVHLQSQETLSVSAITKEAWMDYTHLHQGVYYDNQILLDINTSPYGTGIITSDFRNRSYFSQNSWVLYDEYSHLDVWMNNIYPELMGFQVSGNYLYIRNEAELIYFNRIINNDLFGFNRKEINFVIQKDMDLLAVRKKSFKQFKLDFVASLHGSSVYYYDDNHQSNTAYFKRDDDFYSSYAAILNLEDVNISATEVDNHVTYGLFSQVSGSVQNINFVGFELEIDDISRFSATKDYVTIGYLTGEVLKEGKINGIGLFGDIKLASNQTLTNFYMGAAVGLSHGSSASSVSYNSENTLDFGVQIYDNSIKKDIYIGGVIGAFLSGDETVTSTVQINSIFNAVNIIGMSFSDNPINSRIHFGGAIGYVKKPKNYTVNLSTIYNYGDIEVYNAMGTIHEMYFGGAVGLIDIKDVILGGFHVSSFCNTGKIDFVVNLNQKVKLSGVGNIVNANEVVSPFFVSGFMNYGEMSVSYIGGIAPDFGNSLLGNIDIDVAGLSTYAGGYAYFQSSWGFFGIMNVDITIVKNVTGGIIFNNSYSDANALETDLLYKYDSFSNNISNTTSISVSISGKGKINVYSTNKVYHDRIKVSGLTIGKKITLNSLGGVDIDFNLTHEAPSASIAMIKSDLNLFDERYIMIAGAENGMFTGSAISKINVNIADFGQKYNLYVTSGILTLHNDASNVNISSINEGDINVKSSIIGNSYVAGAAIFINKLWSMSGTNLANIYNELNMSSYANLADYTDRKVISGGIAALIYNPVGTAVTTYGHVSSSVNYGNITSVSKISNVKALSGGFIGTTNYGINGTPFVESNIYSTGTSLNYGNIIAWSDSPTTVGNITAAGGIVADGKLYSINSYINYGNIYTNGYGGGVAGFVKKHLGAMNNIINYGQIRKITVAPTEINEVPAISTNKDKLGALFGYLYLSTTNPFRRIANFDKGSNWISQIDNGTIMTQAQINTYKETWATLSNTDTSPYPLLGNIKVYTLDDSATGIYHSTFFFKATQDSSMAFLQTESTNAKLMQKIGLNFNVNNLNLGLYAAGKNGDAYFPEGQYQHYYSHFHVNPSNNGGDVWMKDVTEYGSESLYEKINFGIRQTAISKNMRVSSGNLETNFTDEWTWNSYYTDILDNGVPSSDGHSLEFYADTNLGVNYDVGETYKDTHTYIKADAKYASYGAVFVGGVWKGTHSLLAGSYQLQANGTHVKIPVKIYDTPEHGRNKFNQINVNFIDNKTKSSYLNESGQEVKNIKPARISNSTGPYDEFGEMRGINNEIIDSLSNTSGSIRAYSEAYVHNDNESLIDPSTYKDIKIIIKRLNDFELIGLYQSADNLSQFTNTTNYKDLTFKEVLPKNSSPVVSFTYKNAKVMNSVNIIDPDAYYYSSGYMDVYFKGEMKKVNGDTDFGSPYHGLSANYSPLSVNYDNMGNMTYVNGTNYWDGATMRVNFSTHNLDGGDYIFTFQIGKNANAKNIGTIKFSVAMSDYVYVHSVSAMYSNYPLIKDSLTEHIYSVKIPYGMSYDSNNFVLTSIVNFENYKAVIGRKQRDSISLSNIYISYDDALAYISKADVTVSLIDGKRHKYVIDIEISSESGVNKIPIKVTIEEVFDPNIDVKNAYRDDVKITNSFYDQRFSGDENPAFRYEYDFTNLFLKNYLVTAEYTGMGSPLPNVHYNLIRTANGFRMAFNDSTFAGLYKVNLNFDKTYTFVGDDNPLKDTILDWTVEFNTPEFYKIGSNESLIKDIAFISESSFTGYETVIDYQTVMTQTRYLQFLDGTLIRPISLIPTLGIDYKTHADESLFYIVGQVAKTDLSHYAPVVELSKGAIIRKVLDDGTLDTDLFANYNPGLIEFAYHKYRVFAESYIPGHAEFGDKFKDYVIAVHDVEDSVTINLTVEFSGATNPFNKVFFNIKVLQNGTDFIFDMSFNAYFDNDLVGYKKTANEIILPGGTSGMYFVTPSINDLYEVEYYVAGASHGKTSFGLPAYILPRKYDVKFVIREKATINLPGWGQTN